MKVSEWAHHIRAKLSCEFEEGIFYKLANKVIKGIDCTCCIFWRGFIAGAITLEILLIIVRFFKG